MAEVTAVPQTAPVTPAVQVEAPKEDLLTRVSKVITEKVAEPNGDSIAFNVKDLEKIADPQARKLAEDAYKSFQADYTRKTQELASQRRALESKKGYDIPQMLNDPEFVRAAQEYQRINGGQNTQHPNLNGNADLSDEEFSYLTTEQQKLYIKTKQMEQSMGIINNRLQAAEVEKEDVGLKSKYANYSSQSVNDIYQGMMTGKIQATREHLWKVQDYDDAVKRAYQLGKEDRKLELGEKFTASSQSNGVTQVASGDVPVRLEKESGIEYFKRIAYANANKLMSKK